MATSLTIHIIYHKLSVNVTSFLRLLDILAGRKDRAGLSGHVLVNGQRQPSNFKCISGYVVQVGAYS